MLYEKEQEYVSWLEARNREYRDGNPTVSDSVYDAVESELEERFPNSEFLKNLEDDRFLQDGTRLTIHMGSQNKAMSLDEMEPFYKVTGGKDLHGSFKMDGQSGELTYVNGVFRRAVTRGDGTYGVNITKIVRESEKVPETINLSGKVVIRGELYLTKSDLKKINAILIEQGRKPYKNVRNGIASLTKTLKNAAFGKFISFAAFDFKLVTE